MAGLDTLKSKIKRLGDETEIKKRKRTVITFAEYDEIQRTGIIPDDINENSGWLVVPGMKSPEEWVRESIEAEKKKQG